MKKHISLLRGINVGGHKKVPMVELKKLYEQMGFSNIKTLLNSGNVVFEGEESKLPSIADNLEKQFGFKIPVINITFKDVEEIVCSEPFRNILLTPKTRLYVTILDKAVKSGIPIPYKTEDDSFKIIEQRGQFIFSVLDLEKTGTIDGMKIIEKTYGKNLTTRNFNTIEKIVRL